MLSDGNLRLGKLWGGTEGWTDGRTDGRTDIWKFTPVSYRTSALWGRCPKRRTMLDTRQPLTWVGRGDVGGHKTIWAVKSIKIMK